MDCHLITSTLFLSFWHNPVKLLIKLIHCSWWEITEKHPTGRLVKYSEINLAIIVGNHYEEEEQLFDRSLGKKRKGGGKVLMLNSFFQIFPGVL